MTVKVKFARAGLNSATTSHEQVLTMMNRHTAVLEKSLPRTVDNACDIGITRSGNPATFCNLVAQLFLSADPVRIVAFVSVQPGEGVTYTVNHLSHDLRRLTSEAVLTVTCEQLQATEVGEEMLGLPEDHAVQKDAFARLLEHSRYVLIDAGAIDASPDVVRIASRVDGVVLVVEAGRTTREQIARAVNTISTAQGKLLGVVLNKRRYPIPSWLFKMLF